MDTPVYLINSSFQVIVPIIGIILGLSGVILAISIHKQRKEMEKLDKGKKLIEVEQRRFEILPKYLSYGLVLINLSVVMIVIMGAMEGHYSLPLLAVVPSITVFSTPRKIEIYEKGIKHGLIFVKWNEVENFEWENGVLKIKTKKVLGGIQIKDADQKVKRIVEERILL